MRMVTDFHSHILPGIDDGSTCTAQSLAMLSMAAEQGVRHMVATPHFDPYHDTPEQFLSRRAAAQARLCRETAKHPGLPEISLGAEVAYFPRISDWDALPELTMAGSGYVLLEMPAPPWTASMYRELENIWEKQGITPVIAHIDRYLRPFRTYGILQLLRELPVLVQANGSFFLGQSTANMALRLLREEKIQLLGSDCHNVSSRPPNLGPAVQCIRRKLGPEALDWISFHEQEILAQYA